METTARYSLPKENWFNATTAAYRLRKRPTDWLRMPETKRYLHSLYKKHGIGRSFLIETRKIHTSRFPRGTWFHPLLALPFARWLDIGFSAWCDEQLDTMLRGQQTTPEVLALREAAANAHFKIMEAVLNTPLPPPIKKPIDHVFIGKARLINWAINGRFCQLDRDALMPDELVILTRLETRNQLLLGNDEGKVERKQKLAVLADELYQEGVIT